MRNLHSLVKELNNLQLKTLNDLRIVQGFDVFNLAEGLVCACGKTSSLTSDHSFWMKLRLRLILRSMLLLSKVCLVNLANMAKTSSQEKNFAVAMIQMM